MKKTQKQILEEFPGLKDMGVKSRASDKAKANRKRREICDFARDHNLVIHPGKGYDYYIESYFMFNCCPCDKTRHDCPCNEAVEEIARDGYCKCRLFWRSHDDFKEKMLKEA